jgi:hypothetical protein
LYPSGPGQANLVISGSVNEIEIAIQEGKATLLRPSSPYLDKHVKGVWMQPASLFKVHIYLHILLTVSG